MHSTRLGTALLLVLMFSTVAFAHRGRRFDIQVWDGQLVARGENTGPDDMFPAQRPYINSIHDHFVNVDVTGDAIATVPGFDLRPGELTGSELALQLTDAFKWHDPPMMPPPGTIPDFEPFDVNELIYIEYPTGEVINTRDNLFDSITLASGDLSMGKFDIDPIYSTPFTPTDTIYVLEWTLKTDSSGVADSESLYTILSPDGENMMDRLHHGSLYTEQYLGIAIAPEPATWALGLFAAVLALAAVVWRKHPKRIMVEC